MSRRHYRALCPVCNGPMRQFAGPRIVRINRLRNRCGENCAICQQRIRFDLYSKRGDPHDASPSLDHIHKREHGGCDHEHNFQLTHTGCNNWRDWHGTEHFAKLFAERIAPFLSGEP